MGGQRDIYYPIANERLAGGLREASEAIVTLPREEARAWFPRQGIVNVFLQILKNVEK
jgi:hypothetical protein